MTLLCNTLLALLVLVAVWAVLEVTDEGRD